MFSTKCQQGSLQPLIFFYSTLFTLIFLLYVFFIKTHCASDHFDNINLGVKTNILDLPEALSESM